MVPRQLTVVGVVGDTAGKKESVGCIYPWWKREATERRGLVGFGFPGRLANCISQGGRIRGNRAGNLVDASKRCRSAKADVISRGRVRLTGLVARRTLDRIYEIQAWAQQ